MIFRCSWCINEVLPCNPDEGRRLDGTCNNLKYPNRGAPHTPQRRLLPAEYDKGTYIFILGKFTKYTYSNNETLLSEDFKVSI